jgi:hypothetical protein
LYEQIRDLSSRKKGYGDAFSAGPVLESLVGQILREIVAPFDLEHDSRVHDSGFDWRLELGRSRTVLFEVVLGSIASFRLKKFVDIASLSSDVSRKRLNFVAIGKSLEESDDWYSKMDRLRELGTNVVFLDFETLFSLHQFTLVRKPSVDSGSNKRYKRDFLESLFSTSGRISDDHFTRADTSARSSLERVKGAASIRLNEEPLIDRQEAKLRMTLELLQEIDRKLNVLIEDVERLKAVGKSAKPESSD